MRYRVPVILLVSLFLSFIAVSQPVSTSIENRMTALLQEEKLSGAVFSVIQSDSVKVFGRGLKNSATGEQLTATAKVHVGSVTKTILALGILRMATENKLKLDDEVLQYLPALPVKNPWASKNPITIRHLLDHTAGFSDLRIWHFFSSGASPDMPLDAFYSNHPEVLNVYSMPGTIFSYSNIGYTILGMVIEAIAKKRYEDYLDSILLKPLGMHESSFHFSSQIGPDANTELAMGHFDNGEIAPAMAIFLRPAGQFTTTGEDMGKLMKFLLDQGQINGEYFIRKDLIDQIGNQKNTIAAKGGLRFGYSLGAVARDRHGVVGLAHSGNIIGFRAMLYLFPKAGKGFFIACNMDSETADYERLNSLLIAGLGMGRSIVPRQATPKIGILPDKLAGYYIPVLPKVEPFQLLERITSYSKVSIEKGKLSITPFQKKAIQLASVDNRLFIADGKQEFSHLFYENEMGDAFFTTGIQTLKKVSWSHIFLPMISLTMGVLCILFLLISGTIQLIKRPSCFMQQAYSLLYLSICLLLFGVVMAAVKGIIYLGDKNFATVILYSGSIALPVGCLIAIVRYLLQHENAFRKFEFYFVLVIAQFCLLLALNGILPLATWS
jgi:CubicO group peptidase (beta-lactamase class C family)